MTETGKLDPQEVLRAAVRASTALTTAETKFRLAVRRAREAGWSDRDIAMHTKRTRHSIRVVLDDSLEQVFNGRRKS